MHKDHEYPEPYEGEATDTPTLSPDEAEAQIRHVSRRSFLLAAGAAGAVAGGLWLFDRQPPDDMPRAPGYVGLDEGLKSPLRRVLGFNAAVARRLFWSSNHRATEYPRSYARVPRNNYKGETPQVDLAAWNLTLTGLAGGDKTVTLADIKALPRVSQTTELKCIEGWSVITNWTGARFVDFAAKFPPPPGTTYVAMRSDPDGYDSEKYYVGLDLASALHPQTLLAYEMNDQPLSVEHGAPLRLVIPTKYGIKNIKLITSIAYTPRQPADYWYEQGYDYYAGL